VFLVVKSIGRGSNFAFTYRFNALNFTQPIESQTIQTGRTGNTSAGFIEVAKVDTTTVIVLGSIFGTLGAMIAIAILIYVYGLIKAWVKSKWKTDIIKPLPMPP
jgi:hypothetical protein